jgi:glycine dehydrogenase
MISIYEEIKAIEELAKRIRPITLKKCPAYTGRCLRDEWKHPYSRKEAAFPLYYVTLNKFWPSVARVNNTYGDRNLICTCEPTSAYAENSEYE